MAKTLSKTGISVGLPVTAAQLSQSIDALTGVDAYDISISGSLTTTGSLRVIGNISHTGNLTTSGVITGTNVQSLGTLTADGDLTTFANSALGNAITDTITINGNITGSGDIKVAGLVSASSLNITGNSTLGNSITDTTTIGGNITGSGNITLASYVSSSIIIGKKNSLAQDNSGGANIDVTTNNDFFPGTLTGVTQTTSNNIVAYTLPAAEAGLHYTFIATVTSTGTGTTTFKAPSAILNGIAICDNGTEDISGTNFIFAATKFIKGTRIYCISDGNIWHITAFCLCDVADVSTT